MKRLIGSFLYSPYNKCPVIFRWIRMVLPPDMFISIFFARLSIDKIFFIRISFLKVLKNFGLAADSLWRLSLVDRFVQTSFITRPDIVFLRPLVVVSTSGSSGMV